MGDKASTTRIIGYRTMADTRFEVRMSEALAQELEAIAEEAQLSKAEVFRRAIALYGLTKRAIMNKEEVIIRNGDRERQLVSI
jgi:metal-responsive CopG/Arc/MetJ family transcriptional regulator